MTSPSAPEVEDKLISNFTIRSVLETLRELNPAELPVLLKEAHLDRLHVASLADDAPMQVHTSELAKLYSAVFRLLGETLTRVFLTNYGHKLAPMLLKHPEMVKLIARGPSIPSADRPGWAMREVQKFLSSVWASVSLREDSEAYFLEVEHCPICAEIHGTRTPICASSEFIYTSLIRAITGQRYTLLEVTCKAQNAKTCSYRLRK